MEAGLTYEDVVTYTKILSDKCGKAINRVRKIFFFHLLSFVTVFVTLFLRRESVELRDHNNPRRFVP